MTGFNSDRFLARESDPFPQILGSAPVACLETDAAGRVLRGNQALLRLLSVPFEAVAGRFLWDLVAPEEREHCKISVLARLAGSEPVLPCRRTFALPGSPRVPVESRDELVWPGGLRCFLIDETAAVTRLRKSEERLKRFVQQVEDIFYCVDLHGRFTFANPAAARLMGRPQEELVGGHYLDLVRPDWRREAHRFYRRQLARHIPSTYYEFPAVTGSGGEIWFGQHVQLLFEGDRIVGFQAVARDITRRRLAEEELRHAHEQLEARVQERTAELARTNERLSREMAETRRLTGELEKSRYLEGLGLLAGGIAHDFNNLLTIVLGFTGLAAAEVAPGSIVGGYLSEVQRAAEKAAEFTAQLLAYSGQGRVTVQRIDLRALLDELAPALMQQAGEARFEFELPGSLPEIEADRSQVERAMTNLVENAREALAAGGGRILIRAGIGIPVKPEALVPDFQPLPERGWVFIEVCDNGGGVPAEHRPRILDAFYSTKGAGRGLGLPAVMGIMRSHGGSLAINTSEGRGTCVCLIFPTAT